MLRGILNKYVVRLLEVFFFKYLTDTWIILGEVSIYFFKYGFSMAIVYFLALSKYP